MRRALMIVSLAIATSGVLSAASASVTANSGQTQVKACKIQSKQLILQKTSKPLRLTGIVLHDGSYEYHLRSKSDLTVEIQLATDSKLKFNVYSIDPPRSITKQAASWSGTFSKEHEYILAFSNCSGRTTAKYEVSLTAR